MRSLCVGLIFSLPVLFFLQGHCLEEFDELLHKIGEKIETDAKFDWHPVITAVKEFSHKDRRPGYKEPVQILQSTVSD